ncbi:tetratricopeptide repeat protein 27 isoform X1 [Hydra vulgaris]|uniref:tetratricopeptide repeat protein 27 isoform X1 n=1 Tax=Hydra vulgaris TaxID=6087 RepID=UPI001F5F2C5B|nr:tetratricopeptide repeat protein 27-like [Hydra vulgaris]
MTGIEEKKSDNDLKSGFNSTFGRSMLKYIVSIASSDSDFNTVLSEWIKKSLEDPATCKETIVEVGVASLKHFLQANWTGPKEFTFNNEEFNEVILSQEISSCAILALEKDGDDLYQLLFHPILLQIAKIILLDLRLFFSDQVLIWSVKCLSTILEVVQEVNDQHLKILNELYAAVDCDGSSFYLQAKEVQAEFFLDVSHCFLRLYDFDKCKECHLKVQKILQIDLALTASLGKRTKFQENNLPQMRLDINLNESREIVTSHGEVTKELPTDITLNDDTLLPHIKFIDQSSLNYVNISPIDQAFILSTCIYLHKSRPRDKLTVEEVMPYIECVLQAPKVWSIQYKCLYLRCLLEFASTRKMERSITQLEELHNTYTKNVPEVSERQILMHSIGLQPIWKCEQSQAELLLSCGFTDSALEIFLRLHLWDDVIVCYQRLGKHGKAEKIIRNQLAIRETAVLWCLLGDATMDIQYYEKAWTVSNYRSARAQRSIGLSYLRKQMFAEAIPYLQKSLDLNCLQPSVAFSLGCSCMATNQLDLATKALQQCCSLDPDNSQAWNNLASSFIRLNHIQKAFRALKEATRLSYDNWKIWENFLLVSTDIGSFEDSINCVNRLVELKRKTIDSEVLRILVDVVKEKIEDKNGLKADRLKDRLQKMFAYVTSQITSDPYIWENYARLTLIDADLEKQEKALDLLYKSHRCFTQHTEWEKNEKELGAVIRVTRMMIKATKDVTMSTELKGRAVTLCTTSKMCVTNLIIRLKKAFTDIDNQIFPSVKPFIVELEEHVNELQELLLQF